VEDLERRMKDIEGDRKTFEEALLIKFWRCNLERFLKRLIDFMWGKLDWLWVKKTQIEASLHASSDQN
jgi:hypothetical protein